MPPVVIAAGIGAIGALGGAAIAADANKSAASTQAGSTQQALDFEKEAYNKRLEALGGGPPSGAPGGGYSGGLIGLAAGAGNRLGNLYGFPSTSAPAPAGPGGFSPIVPSSTTVSPGYQGGAVPGMTGAPQGQSGMVTVRAPTGETRQVPAGLATFYQGKGAQIVSA